MSPGNTGLVQKAAGETVDPVLWLLFAGMAVFAGLLFVCEKWWPNDGQLFQVIASLLAGFSGSFFTRLKPRDPGAGSGATQVSVTTPAKTDTEVSVK